MTANRREFFQTSLAAGLGVGALLAPQFAFAQQPGHNRRNRGLIRNGNVVLFQGDSITDTGRSRETEGTPNVKSTLGSGYAWLAAAERLVRNPDNNVKFYNRGISGNKVHQLAERWDKDAIELKPDVLSILIGVNDFWHAKNGQYDGTVETYENDYRALLERTRKELPDVKIVICEPFILKCGAVDDSWYPEFDKFRAAAKKLAEETNSLFVPFQAALDRAVKIAPPETWGADGVHPSQDGAAILAREWNYHVGMAVNNSAPNS